MLDPDLLQHIDKVGACVRVPERLGIRVSGADAARYLEGQITNDLSLAGPDKAIFTFVTDAKGRLEGVAWVHRTGEETYLVDAPIDLEETLPARLERYAIADEVEFETMVLPALTHRLGGGEAEVAGVRCLRFGVPGLDLVDAETPELGPAEIEQFRILQGFPAWGHELTPGLLAPEAGIEALAISYAKGCYIGQEVISRVRSAGKTNRRLVYLISREPLPEPLPDGAMVFDGSGSEVGRVTSQAHHPLLDRSAALAYVKTKFLSEEPLPLALGAPGGSVRWEFDRTPAPYRVR